MKRKARVWVFGAIAALIVVAGGWALSAALGETAADTWALRGGLWLLGLAAVGLVVTFVLRRIESDGGDAAAAAGPDEIDLAVSAARSRLGSSKVAGGATLGNLPLVVVLGPDGAAKTTIIVRSGLEAELLAGEIAQGDAIVPTRAANLWYAGGTMLVEAGGAVVRDPPRWARLVRHLHPQRLSAVFATGQQAPRVALVCFSCEDLLKAGNSEAVPAAARALRARLGELAEQLGIRLPVYVLFTKADRIPHFAEYVHNFSRDESRQVLGATLEAELDVPVGAYADRATSRVGDAFAAIFRSLAEKRLAVLSREHASERRPGAYEFPREVRKIIPVATQFLVELCRPSQLHASPFLRGFYFTGVQAVIVTESLPVAAAQPARAGAGAAVDATSVFQARHSAPSAVAMPAAAPVSRKVPRWVFLDRIFPEVLLADRPAHEVTRGGTRVDLLRRMGLGMGVAAGLLLTFFLTVSFAGNRSLQRRTAEAARAAALLPAAGAELPAADALARLDSLGARLAQLRQYREDRDIRLQWGLYRGDQYFDAVRATYFAAFDRVMFGSTRRAMTASLGGLPATPEGSDYAPTYALLKAYLITTSHPDSSTVEFLPPVLMQQWLDGRAADSLQLALARRQLDLYASELRYGNPLPAQPDPETVRAARAFLARYTGTDHIYQFMIAEAGRTNPPVRLLDQVPGAQGLLASSHDVPGAYTRAGWAFVANALENDVEQFFAGEAWVIGDRGGPPPDRVRAVQQLRTQYVADYRGQWRSFLRGVSVLPFRGTRDAAQKLATLGGSQSPLLRALSLVAQHTEVDTVGIRPAFQPVHLLTPAGGTLTLVSEKSKPYVDALLDLRTGADLVAPLPQGAQDPAFDDLAGKAANARNTIQRIGQEFSSDADVQVRSAVLSLMEAPVLRVDDAARFASTPNYAALGAAFCAQFGELMTRFPFSPGAATHAQFSEVATVFHPQTGALWRFHDQALGRLVERQGTRFVERRGVSPAIAPAFLAFFNDAAAAGAALYGDGGETPRAEFSLRPLLIGNISAVTVTVDGEVHRFTREQAQPHTFVWNGPRSSAATIVARVGRSDLRVAARSGAWALFQIFQDAEQFSPDGTLYRVAWEVRNNNNRPVEAEDGTPLRLTMQLNLGTAPPIFQDGYFSRLRCPGQVTR